MADFLLLEDFPTLSLKAGDRVADESHDVDLLVRQGISIVPYDPDSQDSILSLFRQRRRLQPSIGLLPLLSSRGVDGMTLSRTVRRLTIHVDAQGGDDSNDGSGRAPLGTLGAAEQRIPLAVAHDVVIHVQPHPGLGYEWPTFRVRQFVENKSIWIIFDQFSELVSQSLALGGSSDEQVVTAGLAADALNGKTIEILTGAATGDRRMILRNTTTTIEPCANFTQPVATNDLFRVIEPDPGNVVIPVTNVPMVLGSGVSESAPLQEGDFAPGLRLVNVIIQAPDDMDFCADERVSLFGCEILNNSGVFRCHGSGQVLMGRASWNRVTAPEEENQPFDTLWIGWGAAWTGSAILFWTGSVGFVGGYVVSPRWNVNTGVHEITGHLTAAALRCIGEADPNDTSPPRVSFGALTPFVTPRIRPGRINNTVGALAAIDCGTGGLVIVGEDTIIDSAGVCIRCQDARVRIIGDLVLNTGTVGFLVNLTGELAFLVAGAAITVGTISGNEVEVGNTPATSTIAALFNSGSFLKDTQADDNSIVHAL